ncbi:MAG: translation initiation factor IF-2, partial [Myxococcota bacterium]|nr:translation initiation factor IF-2 [Myxococcota bacterium]
DEARTILRKGKGAGEASAEKPVKKRRPGMMIVRKKKVEPVVEAVAEEAPAETPAEEAAVPAPVEAPVEAALEAAPASEEVAAQDEPAPVVEPEVVAVVDESPEPVVAEEAPISASEEAVASVEASEEAPSESAPSESAPAAETAPAPAPAEEAPVAPGKAKVGGAKVVRMIDRDKLLERVPSRRLGGGNGNGNGGRPARRGPPGNNGFGAPQNRGLNEVTELRVVSDPFGRGREMVNVDRDKRGEGGPGGKGKKKGRAPSKREMISMRERNFHSSRLRRKKGVKKSSTGVARPLTQPKAAKRVIKMKETIVLTDLAHQLGVKVGDLIRKLMQLGTMVSQNESVDFDTAQVLAAEYEYTVDSIAFKEDAYIEVEDTETDENLEPRAPVVTIMGHVDHGKTSLLDAIRSSRVAAREAGGITQHIGAYSVNLEGKGDITFIDTPGHAAFTEMRARGAQVTDIVVLVVAADDGMMPQTEEAIRHSQAAGVPIIVAVNKCDLEAANPDRVTQELAGFGLAPEAWGGETLYVNTSAIKGTGLDELLEAILLQTEMLELKANPAREASGVVIEAKLDKGRGPVATILVRHGTLKRGDFIVVGEHAGRVRAMSNYTGKQVTTAGPSDAVEIIGIEGVPGAGDKFNCVASAEAAREISDHRIETRKVGEQTSATKMSLEQIMKRMSGEEQLELKLVVKADVQGSVEAVKGALLKLTTEEVGVSVIYGGVGGITESDIMLAAASNGLVLGFNVRPDNNARRVADREGVEIRPYSIIYEMVDDVKKAMEGLLAPESKESIVGHAEVRDLFRVSKVGLVAGCRVVDGKAIRGAGVRVLRDSVEIYSGKVGSLFHFKDSVREVESGSECGISVDGFSDVKVQDVIEFYTVEEVSRTLDFSNSVI